MRVFCDTSLIVAASLDQHEHHSQAFQVLKNVISERDVGVVAAHSLAEAYSVLTRTPLKPKLSSVQAGKLIQENIVVHFEIVSLSAEEYALEIQSCAARGIVGGQIYDALLLACAAKAKPGLDRIYTFNVRHFKNVAPTEFQERIQAPPLLRGHLSIG